MSPLMILRRLGLHTFYPPKNILKKFIIVSDLRTQVTMEINITMTTMCYQSDCWLFVWSESS